MTPLPSFFLSPLSAQVILQPHTHTHTHTQSPHRWRSSLCSSGERAGEGGVARTSVCEISPKFQNFVPPGQTPLRSRADARDCAPFPPEKATCLPGVVYRLRHVCRAPRPPRRIKDANGHHTRKRKHSKVLPKSELETGAAGSRRGCSGSPLLSQRGELLNDDLVARQRHRGLSADVHAVEGSEVVVAGR